MYIYIFILTNWDKNYSYSSFTLKAIIRLCRRRHLKQNSNQFMAGTWSDPASDRPHTTHSRACILLQVHIEPTKICNCRKKDLCPLDGACLVNNIIYIRPMSHLHPLEQGFILAWAHIASKLETIITSFHMTLSFLNTVYLGPERQWHWFLDQVVYCHASKSVQWNPITLQFVSDKKTQHSIRRQIHASKQKIWTCNKMQAWE